MSLKKLPDLEISDELILSVTDDVVNITDLCEDIYIGEEDMAKVIDWLAEVSGHYPTPTTVQCPHCEKTMKTSELMTHIKEHSR